MVLRNWFSVAANLGGYCMIERIHVYDLDGVLVDTAHRYRNLANGSIDLAYWLTNRTADKIAQDKILPLARQYHADCLNPEIYTVICTARQWHTLDVAFIVGYLGAPDKLIMRPEGNQEHDATLKRKQLNQLFALRQFNKLPKKFWDDNLKNLSACRDLFDSVFHVPSHITGSV
jgi:hypothetical protein